MEYDSKRSVHTSIGFTDPRKKEGALLNPVLFPPAVVKKLRHNMGSIEYAGQYQQTPQAVGGNIFDKSWFNYYDHQSEFERVVVSIDTAFKPSQLNDPTVGIVFGVKDNKFYIVEILRGRFEYPALVSKVTELLFRMCEEHKNVLAIIEDRASGQSLIQTLRDAKDNNLNIEAVKDNLDKLTRASTCSNQVEAGKLYLKNGIKQP